MKRRMCGRLGRRFLAFRDRCVRLSLRGFNRLGDAKKGAPIMDRLGKFFNLTLRYVFEPGLNWVLEHPIISVVVVVTLVYWAVRGYRIL
jgi:hypothetical protein